MGLGVRATCEEGGGCVCVGKRERRSGSTELSERDVIRTLGFVCWWWAGEGERGKTKSLPSRRVVRPAECARQSAAALYAKSFAKNMI